jgi:hypothetical protein
MRQHFRPAVRSPAGLRFSLVFTYETTEPFGLDLKMRFKEFYWFSRRAAIDSIYREGTLKNLTNPDENYFVISFKFPLGVTFEFYIIVLWGEVGIYLDWFLIGMLATAADFIDMNTRHDKL